MEPSEETKSPKSADNVPVSRGSEAVALNCESLKRLTEKGFEDVARKLQDNGVTDNVLGKVTEAQLKELGISPLGWRLKAVDCIQKITGRTLDYKILNDPIHGHIVIHPLCVKIMDTPQFQRLRYIKQLGGAYFVYPGACHNRFEHSLGVCYLAGQLVTSLRDRQPELEISDTDILCVEIAGLCHDLGHGPFSHLFDNYFLKEIGKGDIKHEDLSQEMFDFLVNDNKLSSEFEKYGVTETDKSFIRELIKGRKDYKKKWEYKGRPKEKGFLYDIVANKTNEIDVDKWDYFARDCHMLGINNTFDHTRCMKFARVLKVDETGDDETGDRQICFRDKEVGDFYDMFYTRSTLHRRAYQHVVTKSVERMISEALVKANEILEVPGATWQMSIKLGTKHPWVKGIQDYLNEGHVLPFGEKLAKWTGLIIAETVSDMKAYMKLTDSIFEQILWSTDEKLVESREILMNIHKRKLYKCVGKTSPEKDFNIEKFEERVIKCEVSEILKKNGSPLKSEDIVINTVSLDYGKKEENPVDYIFFYNNPNPNTPLKIRKDEVSKMLPENFAEKWIVCYCKKLETDRIEEAKKAFNEWCKQNKLSWSNESMLGGMTPVKPLPSNGKPTPGKAVKGLHFTE